MKPTILKKPCNNCPFNKVGAISLAPGRVEGIVADLLSSDYKVFHCHKTVHCKTGGEWTEGDDGEEKYRPSGREAICTGSMVYLLKVGRPSVYMRVLAMTGAISFDALRKQYRNIIKPFTKEPA